MEETSDHEIPQDEAGATGILVQHFQFQPIPPGFTPITAIQYTDDLINLPVVKQLQYIVGNWPKMIVDDRGVLYVDQPINM